MNEADDILKDLQKTKTDLVAQKQRDEEIKNSNSDSLYAQALRKQIHEKFLQGIAYKIAAVQTKHADLHVLLRHRKLKLSDKSKNTVIKTALKEARKIKGKDLTQAEIECTKDLLDLLSYTGNGNCLSGKDELILALINKKNEVLTKRKKGRKHKYKKGQIKEAYDLFKKMRGDDTPCFNTFNNWLKLKGVPKGFPGIDDLDKFLKWANEWDAPERRKANRPINGMSEEEIYRKRKR